MFHVSAVDATISAMERGRSGSILNVGGGSEVTMLEADTLVIAETPVAETGLADDLRALGIAFHQVGDCVAPRRASLAFFEGRELARRL